MGRFPKAFEIEKTKCPPIKRRQLLSMTHKPYSVKARTRQYLLRSI